MNEARGSEGRTPLGSNCQGEAHQRVGKGEGWRLKSPKGGRGPGRRTPAEGGEEGADTSEGRYTAAEKQWDGHESETAKGGKT